MSLSLWLWVIAGVYLATGVAVASHFIYWKCRWEYGIWNWPEVCLGILRGVFWLPLVLAKPLEIF